ncbi:hypothetical protein CLV46_2011 [Diaminobutyricimonas aerilata]|uniref:Fibrinogen beta/gamma subunit family protein n=1 Tax=Diaminobutyricimonas aerilata TaxID=1162967 RepID=A0A2M9CKP7_9MICO|nr:fibrinogen-like YCDxxxxGGGW domain-containing protein [Diaminobutyricimonas aerilata]PJJ72439.1 hypothetical protein CLV46_2011 [Diaminobutyricimonas aerilata]
MSSLPFAVSRRAATRAAALGAALAVAASLLLPATSPARAAVTADGASPGTAAASCWEVKQNNPAAESGIYWILTPALVAPEQFYCDQQTDGGGWVLVARGRQGWKGQYNGLRSAETLRETITGTAAFPVAQLPATTVDGLLNKGRVDALADGVRLRRAMNTAGTTWQEVRFKFANRDRWVWTFGAEHRVGAYSFNGVTGSGGQTASFGRDSAYQRVDSTAPTAQNFLGGLAYGSQVTGTTSSSSYLWSAVDGRGSARPFTQMFLRPKLLTADLDFGTIPDTGAPASAQSALPESDALRTVWGVSGLGAGGTSELATEVSAFAQIGDTVYVGGNFLYVQRTENATGADRIAQPYLAAFNVDTGEWISSFRPVLNNQVKALIGLPDGRLAVGGRFTTANGETRNNLVVVDAATGATAPGWQLQVENRTSGGVPQVRGFAASSTHLYVSGAFTHLVRPNGVATSTWNGARVNLSTGAPDGNWNPRLNGTSIGVEAASAGDRTYYSGYFRMSGTVETLSGTALQTTAGAAVVQPLWVPQFSKPGTNNTGNIWQLGVAEAGGKVWLGGSEHSLFAYDRSTFERKAGFITKNGGDFQAVEGSGPLVFGGCHCGDFVYSNAYSWSDIGSGWTQGDKMNLIGAWDAASGAYQQQFSPIVQSRRGFGAWALFQDSRGTLWAGGDFSDSVRAGEANQWSGGFIRFRARDTAAPTTPGSAAITPLSPSSARLSWTGSSDDRGVARYEVLRDARVIATTNATTFDVPIGDAPQRYFVRAVDAAGNRSATTAALVAAPPSESELTLVALASTWSWRYDSTAWPTDWRTPAFDASAWNTGPAPLGFGSASLGTDIAAGLATPKPLSAQFRHSFELDDPATVTNAVIRVRADDGVVVYVNGQEVGRTNLPTGTLTQNTYATAAPRTTTAAANAQVFAVPSNLLVDGTNVIAVSTHLNYRSTPDVSFDLGFTATRNG